MSQGNTALQNFAERLPRTVTPAIKRLSVASLIGQGVLIVSGGVVRVTGSGLGCPTWPKCTAESLTNTPEMGIHGFIEFANRTLTFALAAVGLVLLVMLWNLRKERKDLFWLAAALLGVIPAQAVIGGITVLTGLNPYVVSLHFLVSAALVVISMLLVNRAYDRTGATAPAVARPRPIIRQLSVVAAATSYLAVVLGTLVTGSGPHSGDSTSPRMELDGYFATRLHALPVYLLVATAVVLVVLLWRNGRGDILRNASLLLLGSVILQGFIGYWQYFTGIPITLVIFHMAGASLMLTVATNMFDVALNRGRDALAAK
ncbi:cytochrome c oxidase assembly protein subunit 15 [Arthrobacter stackebrandtii]|uniref:Cytochrome c oxidase assembly protein subunit 15 n=1 Tax=Arthrobacter stackebrandtii TaxID=272161 RepID=A0ABS4Z0J0_9MICC|nr:cytochrome c oxidase assembly protein subunit 15 [Arthrobacter stackebrandtii]